MFKRYDGHVKNELFFDDSTLPLRNQEHTGPLSYLHVWMLSIGNHLAYKLHLRLVHLKTSHFAEKNIHDFIGNTCSCRNTHKCKVMR